MTSSEVGTAAEDLMLMTRENQALTSELATVSIERDNLTKRVQELQQRISQHERAYHILEVEKNDLLATYRIVLQEKRQIEEDIRLLR